MNTASAPRTRVGEHAERGVVAAGHFHLGWQAGRGGVTGQRPDPGTFGQQAVDEGAADIAGSPGDQDGGLVHGNFLSD